MSIRRITYFDDQIAMASGQTTWSQGHLIAHATVTATDVQAGRLSTSPVDPILGVYVGPSDANASSAFGPDALPRVVRWGTGIPIRVEASATIALNDLLTPSSVTAGTVRTAAQGEPWIGRAQTAVTSGGASNIVFADLYPPAALSSTGVPGVAATNVVATETGFGPYHQTKLVITNAVLPAITGGVAQAVGVQLYTFTSANYVIDKAFGFFGITQTGGNINADTPDVGLGTVVATGAVAVLGGTATFEDVMTGAALTNCTGTKSRRLVAQSVPVLRTTTDNLFFNAADTWAAGGDTGALVNGEVTIDWTYLSAV